MSSSEAANLLLYVEDEVLIHELVEGALTDAGFKVALALDGKEALAFIEAHSGELRGLITDINLPDGMDGWEIARAAREKVVDLSVVYVSGGSPHEWASKGVPHSLMLEKPFAPGQLVVAISTLLNEAGQHPH